MIFPFKGSETETRVGGGLMKPNRKLAKIADRLFGDFFFCLEKQDVVGSRVVSTSLNRL